MSHTSEDKRKLRLRQLAAKIQTVGKASFRATCGWGMLNWGCRRERVGEYLEALEWAGLIEVFEKEDRIEWIGSPTIISTPSDPSDPSDLIR